MPRKTVKGKYLTTRVSSTVKQAVTAIARQEKRTTSQVVALLIEAALQRRIQESLPTVPVEQPKEQATA